MSMLCWLNPIWHTHRYFRYHKLTTVYAQVDAIYSTLDYLAYDTKITRWNYPACYEELTTKKQDVHCTALKYSVDFMLDIPILGSITMSPMEAKKIQHKKYNILAAQVSKGDAGYKPAIKSRFSKSAKSNFILDLSFS